MRTRSRQPEGFTQVLDLGSDWLEWTGLSFVYAVWAVRSSLEESSRRELREFLEASLSAGLAALPEVARRQTEPGWSVEDMEAYLRRFHYRLGPDDLEGMRRFEELSRQHGLREKD